MEVLQTQNLEMKKEVEIILEAIEQQKQLNQQHEAQIQTLLKFNQRLLSIIENEVSNRKDNYTLHPISERSERESDLIGTTMNSMIKSRKLAARSERASSTTNSLIHPRGQQITAPKKQRQKSQFDNSLEKQDLSDFMLEPKTGYPVPKSTALGQQRMNDIEKAVKKSVAVNRQMKKEISELKRFKNESLKFYGKKIEELEGLSCKLKRYDPAQQLQAITQKLTLSQNTSRLIKGAIKKV